MHESGDVAFKNFSFLKKMMRTFIFFELINHQSNRNAILFEPANITLQREHLFFSNSSYFGFFSWAKSCFNQILVFQSKPHSNQLKTLSHDTRRTNILCLEVQGEPINSISRHRESRKNIIFAAEVDWRKKKSIIFWLKVYPTDGFNFLTHQ